MREIDEVEDKFEGLQSRSARGFEEQPSYWTISS